MRNHKSGKGIRLEWHDKVTTLENNFAARVNCAKIKKECHGN
jgi:hypothetical protein